MRSNGTCAKAVQHEKRNSTRSFMAGLAATTRNGSGRRDQQRKGGNRTRASEFPREVFSNCGVRACENCKRCLAGLSTESRKCLHSGGCREWLGPNPVGQRQWLPPRGENSLEWSLLGSAKFREAGRNRGGLLHQ